MGQRVGDRVLQYNDGRGSVPQLLNDSMTVDY